MNPVVHMLDAAAVQIRAELDITYTVSSYRVSRAWKFSPMLTAQMRFSLSTSSRCISCASPMPLHAEVTLGETSCAVVQQCHNLLDQATACLRHPQHVKHGISNPLH